MGMAGSGSARAPKRYRYRLHRLKNAYRKIYRREPEIERPVSEDGARQAISFRRSSMAIHYGAPHRRSRTVSAARLGVKVVATRLGSP